MVCMGRGFVPKAHDETPPTVSQHIPAQEEMFYSPFKYALWQVYALGCHSIVR